MTRLDIKNRLTELTDAISDTLGIMVDFNLIEGTIKDTTNFIVGGKIHKDDREIRYVAFRVSGVKEEDNKALVLLNAMIEAYTRAKDFSKITWHAKNCEEFLDY